MARLLGIDANSTTIRTCVVTAGYRRFTLESISEVDVSLFPDHVSALRAAIGQGTVRPDAVAIALSGDRTFYRRLELPTAAQKDLQSVLGFELEGSIPFDMSEAVFDHRVLKRGSVAYVADNQLPIFAALAKTEDVEHRIALVREAMGSEPERIGTGALPLVALSAVLPDWDAPFRAHAGAIAAAEQADAAGLFAGAAGLEPPKVAPKPGLHPSVPFAILDLEAQFAELVVVANDEPVFARTISRGANVLTTQQGVGLFVRDMKQTLAAYRAQGGLPAMGMFLVGLGPELPNAEGYLTEQLGIPVRVLPTPRLDKVRPEDEARLPRFAKALGLAVGLAGKPKTFNLRQGNLEAARSYPFLQEKTPLLAGLAAVIAVSFVFSTCMKLQTLDAENELLQQQLAATTRDVVGEELTDPTAIKKAIEAAPAADEDPLPKVDAFDVMLQLSKAVPNEVVHDVLDFDVNKNHVRIEGKVPTTKDAEAIAEKLREHKCMSGAAVKRVYPIEGVQKYAIEFDVKCDDPKKKSDAAAAGTGSAKADGKDALVGDKSDKAADKKADKGEP